METILITKDKKVARLAEASGVSRIMVDLEILGKKQRQGHLNTVISEHTLEDVKTIGNALTSSDLLVRVNPMNPDSKSEIDNVINAGAKIIMLPMFKTANEVASFVAMVDKRAKVCLLLETPEALVRIDDIVGLHGIDEIHVGLNDLHLAMGLTFMFELLSGGIVEYLSAKIRAANIRFGFGGIARLGKQTLLDAELILSEHVRLNSEMVILSRDFKAGKESYEELINEVDMKVEISRFHSYLKELNSLPVSALVSNKEQLKVIVDSIVENR